MKRLLVVDMTNFFIRHWIVNPTMNPNGECIGGIMGCLRGLQKHIREIGPDRIVIVWDGEGGSKKRKSINKGYKEGRNGPRKNYEIPGQTKEESLANQIWQMGKLMEVIDLLPMNQIIIPDCEADDVISFVVQMNEFDDWQKVILSSDRDFHQLLNSKTIQFRPIQNQYVNVPRMIKEEKIHPANFAVVKSIIGDKSDNVAGVPGVGAKRLTAALPMLSGSNTILLSDVFAESKRRQGENMVFDRIWENRKKIEENYRLVNLSHPMMSPAQKDDARNEIENWPKSYEKADALKTLSQIHAPIDGLDELFNQQLPRFRKN